jgi:hypothetical protein
MRSDAVFTLIVVAFVAGSVGLWLSRRLIARSHRKRVIKRLHRGRATRSTSATPTPGEALADAHLVRRMDARVMSNRADHAPPVPLSRRPYGIETFRVVGTLDAEPVYAQWDGRWANGSRRLIERVALAKAVDAAFAAPDTAPTSRHPSPFGNPEEFLLAVLTCCDDIDVAEYEIGGHRRAVGSEIDTSARRFRED